MSQKHLSIEVCLWMFGCQPLSFLQLLPHHDTPFPSPPPPPPSAKSIRLWHCVCLPFPVRTTKVVPYFQAEGIHPDCAIISEHLRAREACKQTRRSETQSQGNHSGGSLRDASDAACTLKPSLWVGFFHSPNRKEHEPNFIFLRPHI